MLLIGFLGCDPTAADLPWRVTPVVLGEPLADDSGFDPADGDALGAAFPQLMPGWGSAMPPVDVPLAIWEIALHHLVAEEGVCPFRTLDGATSTYQSGCRSKHGYDWDGTVAVEAWEEEGREVERYDFDIQVVSDVESRRFDSLLLRGSVLHAEGGGVDHADVNLQAELLGYYEARKLPEDPRIVSWSDWQASGSVEHDGEAMLIDLAADVGGSGGFSLVGGDLAVDDACPVEPSGSAQMSEGVMAKFDGPAGCDACANIESDDGSVQACAPG